MTVLLVGILGWMLVHFIPSLAPGLKSSLVSKLGDYGYKAVFTLLMVVSIFFIISGWKSAPPELMYVPPTWGRHVTALLVLFTFITFFAPYLDNNIRRLMRHPQLLGVAAWGLGHMLANGEVRSVLLFGLMMVWALLEIVLINRREGDWDRPAKAPFMGDFKLLLTGVGFYALILYMHHWLFGVMVIPA